MGVFGCTHSWILFIVHYVAILFYTVQSTQSISIKLCCTLNVDYVDSYCYYDWHKLFHRKDHLTALTALCRYTITFFFSFSWGTWTGGSGAYTVAIRTTYRQGTITVELPLLTRSHEWSVLYNQSSTPKWAFQLNIYEVILIILHALLEHCRRQMYTNCRRFHLYLNILNNVHWVDSQLCIQPINQFTQRPPCIWIHMSAITHDYGRTRVRIVFGNDNDFASSSHWPMHTI